jgi:hypothetical protein
MNRLVLSILAALLVGGVATSVFKSHAFRVGQSGMPSIQDLQTTRQSSKLPAQDFEDRSLVFAREPTR